MTLPASQVWTPAARETHPFHLVAQTVGDHTDWLRAGVQDALAGPDGVPALQRSG